MFAIVRRIDGKDYFFSGFEYKSDGLAQADATIFKFTKNQMTLFNTEFEAEQEIVKIWNAEGKSNRLGIKRIVTVDPE